VSATKRVGRCLIRDYRKRFGYTQAKLGILVGMEPNRVSDYENLRYVMKVDTALRFAEVFGCTIEDLYEWIETDASETEG